MAVQTDDPNDLWVPDPANPTTVTPPKVTAPTVNTAAGPSGTTNSPAPTPTPTPTPAPVPANTPNAQGMLTSGFSPIPLGNGVAPANDYVNKTPAVKAPTADQAPSYVNMSDPTQAAVWAAFQAKGITPRDQSDFQYWVDHINTTGGESNQGNASWWGARMAQGQGGVGDYLERPETGGVDTTSVTSGSALSPADLAKRDALYAQLSAKAGQSLTVDPNDPAIRQQADANSANVERQKRQYLSGLAESSGPYASNTAETRLANEQAGQSEGSFEAGLVGNELTARRTEIQNALTEEGSMLSDDQKTALSQQLAQITAAIQNKQLDQQNTQFGQTLDFNMQNQTAYWNNVANGTLMP